MSIDGAGGTNRHGTTTFPQIAGAALLVGGVLAVATRINKRAAMWAAIILLLGIMVYRRETLAPEWEKLVSSVRG